MMKSFFFANFEARDNSRNYAWASKYTYSYKEPYDSYTSRPERI